MHLTMWQRLQTVVAAGVLQVTGLGRQLAQSPLKTLHAHPSPVVSSTSPHPPACVLGLGQDGQVE